MEMLRRWTDNLASLLGSLVVAPVFALVALAALLGFLGLRVLLGAVRALAALLEALEASLGLDDDEMPEWSLRDDLDDADAWLADWAVYLVQAVVAGLLEAVLTVSALVVAWASGETQLYEVEVGPFTAGGGGAWIVDTEEVA